MSATDLGPPDRNVEIRGEVIDFERIETLAWVNQLARKYTDADFTWGSDGEPRDKAVIRIDGWAGQGKGSQPFLTADERMGEDMLQSWGTPPSIASYFSHVLRAETSPAPVRRIFHVSRRKMVRLGTSELPNRICAS
jgi:hypothetical protein